MLRQVCCGTCADLLLSAGSWLLSANTSLLDLFSKCNDPVHRGKTVNAAGVYYEVGTTRQLVAPHARGIWHGPRMNNGMLNLASIVTLDDDGYVARAVHRAMQCSNRVYVDRVSFVLVLI
jgi:hypothetical protein